MRRIRTLAERVYHGFLDLVFGQQGQVQRGRRRALTRSGPASYRHAPAITGQEPLTGRHYGMASSGRVVSADCPGRAPGLLAGDQVLPVLALMDHNLARPDGRDSSGASAGQQL